jgi:hypothetical protein
MGAPSECWFGAVWGRLGPFSFLDDQPEAPDPEQIVPLLQYSTVQYLPGLIASVSTLARISFAVNRLVQAWLC